MELPTTTLIVLVLFVAASLYFHFRGRVRFKLLRQLGDYSTLLAPYNAFACLFSSLRSRPIHDVGLFPELSVLRANWRVIRDEAQALLAAGAVRESERQDDIVFYSFMKRGWKRFYLKWYRGFLPSALAHCPRTVELLRGLPCVHGAMFALLAPHSRLGKHRDPFAGALRYHLALITPNSPECRMFVDEHEHVWRDGEDVLFDSSFIHRAANKTDQVRVVLFCDIERPMRGPVSRAINRFVLRRIVPVTETPNVPGERLGVMNRLFACLRPVRRWIGRLKEANAPAYYALKIAVFVLVLALVLWP